VAERIDDAAGAIAVELVRDRPLDADRGKRRSDRFGPP
jgi:hypothetical protein